MADNSTTAPVLTAPPPSLTVPPAPRPPRLNKYVDALTNQYIESMGNSADLKIALSRSGSAKAQRFLTLLTTPRARPVSVTRLARMAGIESTDLFDIFRDYYHSQGLMEMVKALPELAKDVVQDSRSTQVDCPRCEGWGKVIENPGAENPVKLTCPRCEGSGKMRKSGDPDARKLLAETVGWTKRGGSGQSVNINVNAVGVESVIEELERAGGRNQPPPLPRRIIEVNSEPAGE